MYDGKDQRTGEVETRIMNVLAEVRAGKIKLQKRDELEESYAPALHRQIGGAKYVSFCNYFRALRGLKAIISKSSSIFDLVNNIIDTAHPMDLHNYHDRRSY